MTQIRKEIIGQRFKHFNSQWRSRNKAGRIEVWGTILDSQKGEYLIYFPKNPINDRVLHFSIREIHELIEGGNIFRTETEVTP